MPFHSCSWGTCGGVLCFGVSADLIIFYTNFTFPSQQIFNLSHKLPLAQQSSQTHSSLTPSYQNFASSSISYLQFTSAPPKTLKSPSVSLSRLPAFLSRSSSALTTNYISSQYQNLSNAFESTAQLYSSQTTNFSVKTYYQTPLSYVSSKSLFVFLFLFLGQSTSGGLPIP